MMVGLTGGIGAGKSTVARRFRELGAHVVDADAIAREVVEPGTEGLAAVVAQFGSSVLTAEGTLDRGALGKLVFGDAAARTRLEGILHPRIAARTVERVEEATAGQVVVHDIPLLVELHREMDYDLVVVVDAPQEARLERLHRTRGMDREEAEERMAAQATTEERRAVAGIWISNDGTERDLIKEVDAAWQEILRKCRNSGVVSTSP